MSDKSNLTPVQQQMRSKKGFYVRRAVVTALYSTYNGESSMLDTTVPSEKFSYINRDHMVMIQCVATSSSAYTWVQCITTSRLKFGMSTRSEAKTYATQERRLDVDKCLNLLQSRGYTTWLNNDVGIAIVDDITGQYADTLVHITSFPLIIHIEIHGNIDTINTLLPEFSTLLKPLGTEILTASTIDRDGDMVCDQSHLLKDDSNIARDSFFPWLNVSLDEYFKAFMESDESVLVMFGPPGTGKSTFLRSLILSGNYPSMLAYNKIVVQSPATLQEFYSRNKLKILAYEDIDTHLGSREDGNALMSTILNGAEGIIAHPGKKLIFSTNLESIDKIDPALLRVGRCFDILQFRNLTAEEGSTVLTDMGMEQKDLSAKDSWSLAEVLSKKHAAQQRINRFAKQVGFRR